MLPNGGGQLGERTRVVRLAGLERVGADAVDGDLERAVEARAAQVRTGGLGVRRSRRPGRARERGRCGDLRVGGPPEVLNLVP